MGYKPGHVARVHPRRPAIPPAGQIPSGICECGCGRSTSIATYTVTKRRIFRGYPLPHLHGHGRRKHGPEHHLFKGIHRVGPNGYVFEYAPDNHAAYTSGTHKGYVSQHRLVWERANGRPLTKSEVVHHINGIRDDNRPENLVALTNSAHCGNHAEEHRAGITDETRRKLSESSARRWAQYRAENPS